MKLKRKINDNVQILSHIKEKLQFVGSENEKENDRLRGYDEEAKEVSRSSIKIKLKSRLKRAHFNRLIQCFF